MNIKRPEAKQPTPPHAKRVFKGVLFEIYHWEQKLFDGSVTTFEKAKKRDSVNVYPITEEGKIILSKQEQPGMKPFLGAFGGMMDNDEDPLTAAKRELLEESGYEAKEYSLFDSSQPLEKTDWAIYTFIAKGCKKIKEPHLDGGEKIDLVFLNFTEFIDTVTGEGYRDLEVSLKVLQMLRQPHGLDRLHQIFAGLL